MVTISQEIIKFVDIHLTVRIGNNLEIKLELLLSNRHFCGYAFVCASNFVWVIISNRVFLCMCVPVCGFGCMSGVCIIPHLDIFVYACESSYVSASALPRF